ncbi:hypothetical protein F0919_07010 [Taibaiella lutea]|uniref:Uncharacterized protein n=1 Tax=Taibaiella lutea TaxID=2608001 RepID=A0A5M6CQ30_9BACT|nr:hypothetical protein [Taibaiella lutea]KAA5537418.1 hypothetical protein F0919_07010 [Taibaiella lutea]
MERVKIFVQKIQELYYSKHPKSAIDIDLMLDYTRVMYIDLLEWRKEFTEPVQSDVNTVMQEHAATNNENETEQQSSVQTQETKDEPVNENIIQPATKEETEPATNNSTETEEITQPETQVENIPTQEEEKEPEPELVQEFPEEESIAALSQENTGISFEAPAPAEHFVAIEDTLVEEAPVETQTAIEIPAPTPAEIPLPEIKKYEPAKLFDSIVETKDIRTSIGINDKYLFLNELFNNHKSNYEETLDKLNQIKTLNEAKDWVKTKVAANLHWDDNDGTVKGFYALLEKHFSAR